LAVLSLPVPTARIEGWPATERPPPGRDCEKGDEAFPSADSEVRSAEKRDQN